MTKLAQLPTMSRSKNSNSLSLVVVQFFFFLVTTTTAQPPPEEGPTTSSSVLNILLYSLAILALVVGTLLSAYLVVSLADRLTLLWHRIRGIEYPPMFSEGEQQPKVVNQLNRQDRRRVWQHILQATTSEWQGNNNDSNDPLAEKSNKDDVELGQGPQQSDPQTLVEESQSSFFNDETAGCCICLQSYQPHCTIVESATCGHVFHHNCCLEWLERNDNCPYCREPMISPQDFNEAVTHVLGEDYVAANDLQQQQQQQVARETGSATIIELTNLDSGDLILPRNGTAFVRQVQEVVPPAPPVVPTSRGVSYAVTVLETNDEDAASA